MKWTHDKPDKVGWYWMKEENEDPEVVDVYPAFMQRNGKTIDDLQISFSCSDDFGYVKEMPASNLWAGPIQPPE